MTEEEIRILVLEDDQELADLLAVLLRKDGYRVETASRGEQALEKARSTAFDLVVADIRMEGPSGLDTLARLRENQPDVRGLVITGYSTEADSIRAIRLGVGDYLKKPFELQEFRESVARLVADRRRQMHLARQEEGLRRTLRRALYSVARQLDAAAVPGRPRGGLAAAAERARAASERLELSAQTVDEVELAALLAGLGPGGAPALTGEPEDLPPNLVRILRGLEEWWDGSGAEGLAGTDIPVESRIVCAALESGGEPQPGRFDPDVMAALEPSDERPPPPPRGELARRRRGLLSLGQALEEAGHPAGARAAYTEVEGPSREGVEALLGLARLARAGGAHLEAVETALRGLSLAGHLGPTCLAGTLLEAGRVLGACGDEKEARELLQRAGRLFADTHNLSGEARAFLALQSLKPAREPEPTLRALGILLRPENAGELAASLAFVVPLLMGCAGEAADQALSRILRDFPGECARAVRRGGLGSEAKRRLIGTGGAPAELLKQLTADSDPEVALAAGRALQAPSQAGPPRLRIHSLGPFEVHQGPKRVEESVWRTQKCKYLFAYLAYHRRRPTADDVLIELFWPDKDAVRGRRNLNWTYAVVRRGLGAEGCLERGPDGLVLRGELAWHDVEVLESSLAEGRRLQASGLEAEAVDPLRQAARLYRGAYLEGCYLDWAEEIRRRLELRLEETVRFLLSWAQTRKCHEETLEYALRLLEWDPCDQEAHLAVMRSLVAAGRPAQALRHYDSACATLRRQLRADPGIDLMRARQEALQTLG